MTQSRSVRASTIIGDLLSACLKMDPLILGAVIARASVDEYGGYVATPTPSRADIHGGGVDGGRCREPQTLEGSGVGAVKLAEALTAERVVVLGRVRRGPVCSVT